MPVPEVEVSLRRRIGHRAPYEGRSDVERVQRRGDLGGEPLERDAAVDEHQAHRARGLLRRQAGRDVGAHRMACEHRPLYAEVIQHAPHVDHVRADAVRRRQAGALAPAAQVRRQDAHPRAVDDRTGYRAPRHQVARDPVDGKHHSVGLMGRRTRACHGQVTALDGHRVARAEQLAHYAVGSHETRRLAGGGPLAFEPKDGRY
jgi:hypothetical protein